MANPKEPQSYGSEGDWVAGDVGEEVNRLKGPPSAQHGDFYESQHASERSAPDQRGKVSSDQVEENVQIGDVCELDGEAPPRNVSMRPSGAKRGSYFRERDYK